MKIQSNVAKSLSTMTDDNLDTPEGQAAVKWWFKFLWDALEHVQKYSTDPVSKFAIQSSIAAGIASRIGRLVDKYWPELKAYLDKLDNSGELSWAIENWLSILTNSIPTDLKTATEISSWIDASGKWGKWKKWGKWRKWRPFDPSWQELKFENYLKPLNHIGKIAAESFSKPNQYEYTIVKTGPYREIKATPIPVKESKWTLSKRTFKWSLSTWNINTPYYPQVVCMAYKTCF